MPALPLASYHVGQIGDRRVHSRDGCCNGRHYFSTCRRRTLCAAEKSSARPDWKGGGQACRARQTHRQDVRGTGRRDQGNEASDCSKWCSCSGVALEALHAEPCLFGLFLRVSIRHELYRLSGNPYESATNRGGFDFPGAECPTPLRDLRPESVRPLVEKAREASEFASRKMRGAPIRELPPADPPAPVKPIEIAPVSATPAIVDVPQEQPSKRPHLKYVFNVVFTQQQTGEERIEQVQLGPDEIAETSLDGLGATGPRGREIALRLATARVPAEFMFAGKPNSISLDLTRLINSMNAD